MYIKEKFLIAEYNEIDISMREIPKLRGYFADLDMNDAPMHNHDALGASIYRYPLVQYKIWHGHPMVISYGEGINSLYPKLMTIENITIGNNVYNNPKLTINLDTKTIGDSRETLSYKFTSPWLGLNQNNYKKYMTLEDTDLKSGLIENILIGNILSLCKGFGVQLENRLKIYSSLKEVPVRYKNEKMIGFIGNFDVNCYLPSMCGIGKGVSVGYGSLQKINKKSEEYHLNDEKGE